MAGSAAKKQTTSVLEDPSVLAVARLYAVSFLDASVVAQQENVQEDLRSFIEDILDTYPKLEEIFTSQIVSRDEKLNLIDEVLKPQATPFFINFIRVLAQHDRLGLVRSVLSEVDAEVQRRLGQKTVHVTSAELLSDQAIQDIQSQLSEKLSFEPSVDVEVDPSILGGLIIQIGDSVFDSSLRSRMNQNAGSVAREVSQ